MKSWSVFLVMSAVLVLVGPRLGEGKPHPEPSRERLSRLLYSPLSGYSRWRNWASSHKKMDSLMKMTRHRNHNHSNDQMHGKEEEKHGKLQVLSGHEVKRKHQRALEIIKLALQLLNENEKQRTARETPDGPTHSRGRGEEGNVTFITDDRELCHARALSKCAQKVIEVFEREDASVDQRCDTREGFLKCMIHQKNKPCHPHHHHNFSKDALKMLRQKVLHLLWSARGCVFGIDMSNG